MTDSCRNKIELQKKHLNKQIVQNMQGLISGNDFRQVMKSEWSFVHLGSWQRYLNKGLQMNVLLGSFPKFSLKPFFFGNANG